MKKQQSHFWKFYLQLSFHHSTQAMNSWIHHQYWWDDNLSSRWFTLWRHPSWIQGFPFLRKPRNRRSEFSVCEEAKKSKNHVIDLVSLCSGSINHCFWLQLLYNFLSVISPSANRNNNSNDWSFELPDECTTIFDPHREASLILQSASCITYVVDA